MLRLVEEVKIRHHLLTDKITKNTAVWKDVAAAVSEELSGVSGAQCNQKWRNLKLQCKKFVDHSKKTGRGKMPRPEFFEEVSEILGSSHTIQPPYIRETMGTATATEPQPSTSPVSTESVSPQADISQLVVGSKRKLKPPSNKERLEEKLDKLIDQQAAAEQRSDEQFTKMMEQMNKQHADRMNMMSGLINAIAGKGKGKGKRRPSAATRVG